MEIIHAPLYLILIFSLIEWWLLGLWEMGQRCLNIEVDYVQNIGCNYCR